MANENCKHPFCQDAVCEIDKANNPSHGGPAFGHGAENGHCCGMTIRDYFAGQALVALYSTPGRLEKAGKPVSAGNEYAALAYELADAMLNARTDKR